jgi:hypothetical protein
LAFALPGAKVTAMTLEESDIPDPNPPHRRDADVFIRWFLYTQLGTIAIGVGISYLPTEKFPSVGLVFLAGFMWVLLSAYVYPFLILGWIVFCGKPIIKRLLVLIAGAILNYVQIAVIIALH